VRELENLIERVLALRSDREVFSAGDLPLSPTGHGGHGGHGGYGDKGPQAIGAMGSLSGRTHIPARPRSVPPQVPPQTPLPLPSLPETGLDLQKELSRFEQNLILEALELSGGNRARAAELLKMNRTTLVEKLKRMRLASGKDDRDPTDPF
jgi:DNA-binding NtrC family response regulator